ncbi:hypothetical protein Q9R29_01080 [Rothia sp. ARF10]|nr:hypothetical protein [Rothia sp. ARF10]
MTVIISALALLSIAACGTSPAAPTSEPTAPTVKPSSGQRPEIDREAWVADLAAFGITPPDLAGLEKLTEELCQHTPDEIELFLAVAIDGGADLDEYRVNFEHVCPSFLPTFDAARDSVSASSNSAAEACAKEPYARTPAEADLAEAMGC